MTLHGDFYDKQVILGSEWIGLLDFDETCVGDPCVDLGNFWAHLWRLALDQDEAPHEVASQALDAIVQGYSPTGQRIYESSLRHACALGLFRLLPHAFRSHHPNWPTVTTQMLDEIELHLCDLNMRGIRMKCESSELLVADGASSSRLMPRVRSSNTVARSSDAWLQPALQRDEVRREIEANLPDLAAELRNLELVAVQLKRHKPERRAVVEYVFRSQERPVDVTLLGKVCAKGVDSRALETQRHVFQTARTCAGSEDGSFRFAEPCGAAESLRMWLQTSLPGVEATKLLYQADSTPLAKSVAVALATFHRSPFVFPRHHTLENELEILQDRFRQLEDHDPERRADAQAILDGCRRQAMTLPEYDLCPIHRDFYPDPVLVGPELTLVDLDLYCMGKPALDVGNFVAHMMEFSVRQFGDAHGFARQQECFVTEYVRRSRASVRAIEIYTTLSLARLWVLSTVLPGRAHTTDWLAELVLRRTAKSVFTSGL